MGDDSAWLGEGSELTPLWEIPFPHSLGLLYSAFTYYTGFKVNSGEYKVMGLAPYGRAEVRPGIHDHLLDLKPDGTFRMNMDYFNYCTGLTMTNAQVRRAVRRPAPRAETTLTQREMDLARSIQEVTEEVMLRLARTLHRETGQRQPLPRRRRGAQLRGQRPDPARGAVPRAVDPAGGGRRRRGARRRAARVAPAGRAARARPARRTTPCAGAYLGPALRQRGDRARSSTAQDAPVRAAERRRRCSIGCRRRAGGGQGRRLVPGPDGVRAARARRPQHHRRRRGTRRCSR